MATLTQDKVIRDIAQFPEHQGKVVVLAHGVFDILHPGHIAHLREAKRRGDILVVSVTADEYVAKGPGRPIFPLSQRMEQLASLDSVDFVVPSHAPTATAIISGIKPMFFAKGGDYNEGSVIQEEREALAHVGGKVLITPYYPIPKARLSSLFAPYSEDTQAWLEGFRTRHSLKEILDVLDAIATLNILIVGEHITDRYVFVNTLNKSPREHHLAVKRLHTEHYAGGTVALKRHLSSFSEKVRLVCQQEAIIKERYVEIHENRKLFETEHLPNELTLSVEAQRMLDQMPEFDMVIAMDYGHGLFQPEIRRTVEQGARFLALNCQTNSANYGMNLATKWGRMDYICMDMPEYNLAMANGWDSRLPKYLMITDGARGCNMGENVPSLVVKLVDRLGAGDALFALSAPLICLGAAEEVAAFVGSCAAAMQCEVVGNKHAINAQEMRRFITRLLGC